MDMRVGQEFKEKIQPLGQRHNRDDLDRGKSMNVSAMQKVRFTLYVQS